MENLDLHLQILTKKYEAAQELISEIEYSLDKSSRRNGRVDTAIEEYNEEIEKINTEYGIDS